MDSQKKTEEEFLKTYDDSKYKNPSVTTDILVFSISKERKLQLLLIKRGSHPYQGRWAIPGGFVQIDESLEEGAHRELEEETGLKDIYLEQLYTFGDVDRDPRKRVISVVYMALVPNGKLNFVAGDDAEEAGLFEITVFDKSMKLYCEAYDALIDLNELAFDHAGIVSTALERLRGKVDYTDIAFELLTDKNKFSIYELQIIFEIIKGEKMDIANFRRWFKKKYIDTGRVIMLEEKCKEYSKKPSSYYKMNDSKQADFQKNK